MDSPKPNEPLKSNEEAVKKKEEEEREQKKKIGTIFGYEVSASNTTKNPLLRLIGLITLNIFLLITLRLFLNLNR